MATASYTTIWDVTRKGSLVSLICDCGDRYGATYYNPDWLAVNGIDIAPHRAMLAHFLGTGAFVPPA